MIAFPASIIDVGLLGSRCLFSWGVRAPTIDVFVAVLAITHRHNSMQSLVTGQAPITLE